ncbi:hypothetical protein CPB84DRAFT_932621 [Gymnopilus junonius]|uniref:Uncharacterized protein n=1 Tax=Gymnopilus junonius TaxID=109634 RepID=A0A9P5P241_GYMJU|nr:hypothetical protein CPB84DRAFT_932621 [Gymnopilus junonius]
MSIDEMTGCRWCDGGIMSTESARHPYLLESLTRETEPGMDFVPPSTLSSSSGTPDRRQNTYWTTTSHSQRVYSLERHLILSIHHQEGFADLRIAQDRGADVGRDFLEKDKVRAFGFLEDTTEDEFGSCNRTQGEGIQVPRCKRQVGHESKLLCHLAWCISRRYWCPESGGRLERRESTLTQSAGGQGWYVIRRPSSIQVQCSASYWRNDLSPILSIFIVQSTMDHHTQMT